MRGFDVGGTPTALGRALNRERRESATRWVERHHLTASPLRHLVVPCVGPEQPEAPIAGADTQQESKGSGGSGQRHRRARSAPLRR
jgi:hypothetical protein